MGDELRNPTGSGSELERLKAESERSRIDFLRVELETCFGFAHVAEAEQARGEPEHAAKALADAEKGYAVMARFMSDPKHAKYISEEERAELTAGMERLRATLDKLAEQQ